MSKKRRKRQQANALSDTEIKFLCIIGGAFTAGAWLLFCPTPLAWIGAALYAAGFVTWVIAAFRTEKIGLYDHNEFLAIAPAYVLLFVNGQIHSTQDQHMLLFAGLISLVLAVPFVCADWLRCKRDAMAKYVGVPLLSLGCVFLFLVMPFVFHTNVQLDPHEPTVYAGAVVDTAHQRSKRGSMYYATVAFTGEDGHPQQEKLQIRQGQYQKIEIGQMVDVRKGQGLYGFTYWLIDIP